VRQGLPTKSPTQARVGGGMSSELKTLPEGRKTSFGEGDVVPLGGLDTVPFELRADWLKKSSFVKTISNPTLIFYIGV
jgi:hypothetical protein